MFKVGLTGGIGAGKSVVANIFKELGVEVIDADSISKSFTAKHSPFLKDIVQHFSEKILLESGELDRKQLRQIIFNEPSERIWLENLLHPPIREEILAQLNASKGKYVILESPLMFETGQDKFVDRVIVVDAPEALQIARATARDSSTIESIEKIILSQIPRQERLNRADYIIDNSRDLASTKEQVIKLHQNFWGQMNPF